VRISLNCITGTIRINIACVPLAQAPPASLRDFDNWSEPSTTPASGMGVTANIKRPIVWDNDRLCGIKRRFPNSLADTFDGYGSSAQESSCSSHGKVVRELGRCWVQAGSNGFAAATLAEREGGLMARRATLLARQAILK
jgi:hypothetical protein